MHSKITRKFKQRWDHLRCQLSWIIWETPDFGPYLMVSRLESDISRIITKVAISCGLDFTTIKCQIFCLVWVTVNITFPHNFYCNVNNNVAKYELFMCYIRWSESTSIFGSSDVICRAIWRHLSFLPFEFSIILLFDDVGRWQPWIM